MKLKFLYWYLAFSEKNFSHLLSTLKENKPKILSRKKRLFGKIVLHSLLFWASVLMVEYSVKGRAKSSGGLDQNFSVSFQNDVCKS